MTVIFHYLCTSKLLLNFLETGKPLDNLTRMISYTDIPTIVVTPI